MLSIFQPAINSLFALIALLHLTPLIRATEIDDRTIKEQFIFVI